MTKKLEEHSDPITFKREGDVITLQMSVDNYTRMMLVLGMRAGEAGPPTLGNSQFWGIVKFCNDLNAQNPQYQPYAIPEEFR